MQSGYMPCLLHRHMPVTFIPGNLINTMQRIIKKFKSSYFKRKENLRETGIIHYLFNNSGYVLIIVLLIITMLVSVSTEFLMVAQTDMNYMAKFSDNLKAGILARSAMNMATYILMADERGLAQTFLGKTGVDKNIDCYKDIWALNFPEIPIENGFIKIKISDENAKINLSVLATEVTDDTRYYGMTQRFFINMGLPMDYADAIADWVDIDDSRHPYGAESSDYYLNLTPPYSAKNGAMDSIDELLMIKDMTPEIYYGYGGGTHGLEENLQNDNRGDTDFDLSFLSKSTPEEMLDDIKNTAEKELTEFQIGKEQSRSLSDYFRVNGERSDILSDLNKININTASYRVLSALTDTMTDDIVTEIIRRRLVKPFTNIDEIKDLIGDWEYIEKYISVKSYLFKITAIATVNRSIFEINGIYYRTGKRFLYWSEQ